MARIGRLRDWIEGVMTIVYPVTILQAVFDHTDGKNLITKLAEKAAHGYTGEEPVKTLKEVETEKADEIAQLAGDVNELGIKDAVQGAKIKDIENVLSTANLGQSAQLSVSGRKVVSLPKNASNGGMSVKLEGLTAENLIVNGNFSTSQNIWGASNIIANGELRKPSSSTLTIKDIPDIPIGSKIYARAKLRSAVAGQLTRLVIYRYLNFTDMSLTLSTTNGTMTQKSGIATLPYQGIRVDLASGSDGAYYDDIMVINLTATFGAGNEPTVEECDAMFSDYFDGVKSFVPTGRVRSVDKNGLNPTALYLTSPELRSNGAVKDEIRKGANGYEMVKRISDVDGTVLTTPVITPISYGGVLNSAENGTVFHEPVIADAGVYGTNLPIFNPDYPIASIEEIIKHEGWVDTYLNASTAVIAPDGLSFTHPDLASGDLVLFTYAFDKESTNGNITATFYDSNVVKIDTVTGKAYKITDVVTNGVLTRTLTEV